MLRRTLLAALVALTASPTVAQPAKQPSNTFELYIDEVYDQLAGNDIVFSVMFRDPLTRKVNPPLKVRAGEPVAIKIVNRTSKTRSFSVMSVAGATSAPIRAGASGVVRFKAPNVGFYVYNDPTQPGTGETRSLFGDFIVVEKKN